MTQRFWPAAEAAQVDYESLRAAVLTGAPPMGLVAAHFARCGLAGIIAGPAPDPSSEPVFEAVFIGGQRARWSPHVDARRDALAAGFALILGDFAAYTAQIEEARG